jgi:pSer/pThr/pTyr-binding forkhead associated (FHA) protein
LAEFRRDCGLIGQIHFRVRADGSEEAAQVVDRPFLLIGRSRACDIVLPSRAVAPRHLFVQVLGERLFCCDLGSRSGTRIHGDRRTFGWWEVDGTVQIGPYTLQSSFAGAAPTLLDGGLGPNALEVRGSISSVTDGVSLIGRASPCAFRGADLGLATYHAALSRVAGQLWIIDLRSGKGTRVNGRAVRFGRLHDGDLIEAGGWSAVARTEQHTPRIVAPSTLGPGPAAGALAPFQQMMEHFHQCVMLMGEMMTSVQQQQMQMMREQMTQFREMTRDVLTCRGSAIEIPWADDAYDDALPVPNRPAPKPTRGEDNQKLRQAHVWFTDRLARAGQKGRR